MPLDPEFVSTLGRWRLKGLRDAAQNRALKLRRKGQTQEAARYEAEANVYSAEIRQRADDATACGTDRN